MRMDIKNIGFYLIVLSLLFNGCAEKEPQQKVYRVGIVCGTDFFANTADGFKAMMTKLGYIEGKNIVYELYKTNIEPTAENQILKKLIADKVDMIFTFPTEISVEAKNAAANSGIPVVFANANIEGVKLVDNVRSPGGNITGVRYPGPDLAVKRLEIMHEIIPQAKRIWLPYLKTYPIVDAQLEKVRPVAAAAGLTLIEVPVSGEAELEAYFKSQAESANIEADAILLIAEPIAVNADAFLTMAKFAAEHKIVIGGSPMVVGDYGVVFSVATDNLAVGRQAATLADKIFKGIPAGIIPVLSAESYLLINYGEAQKLGLNVPEGLLSRANEIIR